MLSENRELRAKARAQLSQNWGNPIIVCLLYSIISMIAVGFPFSGGLAGLIIAGPLLFGLVLYSLKFIRGQQPDIDALFEGFNSFGATLGLYLWSTLWVVLWSLLLIIPGIIKAYSYSMAFYIMADNPQVGIRNALKMSMDLTNGYKGKLFVLGLSFIGWAILATFTCGIGFLWLIPYMQMTYANFYNELKTERGQTIISSPAGQSLGL